jgi:hypothetical protein
VPIKGFTKSVELSAGTSTVVSVLEQPIIRTERIVILMKWYIFFEFKIVNLKKSKTIVKKFHSSLETKVL